MTRWSRPCSRNLVSVVETLQQEFGLPGTVAREYGRMLVMSQRPARSFKKWLNG